LLVDQKAKNKDHNTTRGKPQIVIAMSQSPAPVTTTPQQSDNKIQVSSSKQSLSFYVHLAKKFLTSQNEIELSGLGSAINTVVSCAEILKNGGFATISKINTSTVEIKSEGEEQSFPKAKIQVWLAKGKDFDTIMEQQKKEAEEKKQKRQEAQEKKAESQPKEQTPKPSTPKPSTPNDQAKPSTPKTKSPATPKEK
jgi:DNA-binding protein